jgi:glycosyltransferase involved in cell wall biosynthesis
MRVLHVVKTTDGARWALDQVRELVANDTEVHVVLPDVAGRFVAQWQQTGAVLHVLPMDLPVSAPWRLAALLAQVRGLVARVQPDLIHSHFFGTTVVLRMALGQDHPVPRIFQVPGPLHMEHALFRQWELMTAGEADCWIASSQYIASLYRAQGVSADRIFLSYYGNQLKEAVPRQGKLRRKLGIPDDHWVVGNINYIYKPKWYLGQIRGLKRHEDVIDALAMVCASRENVTGLLLGSQWGGGVAYQKSLQKRAAAANKRIFMPGHLESDEVSGAWADFDLAVHVPMSENCGGVVEPMHAGVPVIASRVGGLPEVVLQGRTGRLVCAGNVDELAGVIESVLDQLEAVREQAVRGAALVSVMFDVTRTAREVGSVYAHILSGQPRPPDFDSHAFAETAMGPSP